MENESPRRSPAPPGAHRVAFAGDMFDRDMPAASMAYLTLEHGPTAPSRGRRRELGDHMEMLAREFSGQSLLAFRHAWLIVRIRRDEEREAALAAFRALWDHEAALLIPRLDLRWLVSAADTFLAHPRDAAEAHAGLAGTLAANVAKLYETERLSLGQTDGMTPGPSSKDPLFDGMTAFKVGGGDMLANLMTRVAENGGDRPADRLTRAILDRLFGADTALRRAARVHTSPSTAPAFRPRKVALFNDTAQNLHYGCQGVMQALDTLIAESNGEVIFRHRVGEDWQESRAARAAIGKADLVIVNGEGSIHHSSARARDLAAIGRAASEASVPSALINATIEANDDAVLRDMALFDHVWVRESASHAVLGEAGIESRICPDLTLTLPERPVSAGPRTGQLFIDSVLPEAQRVLARLAEAEGEPLLVMKRHSYLSRILGVPHGSLGRLAEGERKIGKLTGGIARCGDHDAFRDLVAGRQGMTTGRFHAVCYAVLERTPVMALRSNTTKIEATLRDIGLDEARLFARVEDWRRPPPFAEAELESIATYLRRARAARDRMAFELFGR